MARYPVEVTMVSMTLVLAAIAFVGTHFLLSHPLRRPIVGAVGEQGFLLVYTVVAAATLGVTIWAYASSPAQAPLWPVGEPQWGSATLLMLIAAILFVGSLVRNPAMPGAAASAGQAQARGVFAVTRHPMMWAFAIWGVSHILVYPMPNNVVLCTAIIVLALVGAALQDRKKAALDPVGWPAWQARTSYLPFAAIASGRARFGGGVAHALGGGVVIWLVATWAHYPIAGWRVGIWHWLN